MVLQYTASYSRQQDVSTTATPLPVHAHPGQDIPQDAGRANKGFEEQPVERDEVQQLERQPDNKWTDPQEELEELPVRQEDFQGIY